MKNFIKKNWQKIFLLSFYFLIPFISFADGNQPIDGVTKLVNPLASSGIDSLPKLIKTILEGAITIGIPVIALAIVYCGFLFVAARGNSEKLGKAKDALLYTCIGAAVLLGSWAIAQMIQATVTGLSA